MPDYVIHWLSDKDGKPDPYAHVVVRAKTFHDAMWEATRRYRKEIRENPRAVDARLSGCGFFVREAT